MDKYIFSQTSGSPYNHIKVGDWVVYDCYNHSPLASIGVVTAFEEDYPHPFVVLRVWDADHYKTVRRCCYDLQVGLMRKITNCKI